MINGKMLRDAIISGANVINNKRAAVDALNVFPVPDGDTGSNMSMTMASARNELLKLEDSETVTKVADKAASALLRGARGNSGVILSLLFRGFSKGLKGLETASGADIAAALTLGVEAAYKAVSKPTEGTILTVSRVAAEEGRAAAEVNADPEHIWGVICDAAEKALATTPELLPVLKRAGVVDAGGQGLCYIFRGMQSVISGGVVVEPEDESAASVDSFKEVVAEFDDVINFTYCTEFIVRKENDRDPADLRSYLQTIGDCVVVVDDDEIIKVHVHTDNPGLALTKGGEFGQFLTVKVENMREQHKDAGKNKPKKLERVEPEIGAVGFVAVASGSGVCSLFEDLGCQNVVSGGQTMNPSTEDILAAVLATPAETVYVLPNNKNIIMAAEQAVPLSDRRLIVVPTRTIPQGISAMLAYSPEISEEENAKGMLEAAGKVATGQITFAARNSEFDNKRIKEGDILALDNLKLSFIDKDPIKAVVKLAKQMSGRDTSFITVIYGDSISDAQAETARSLIESKVPKDVEVTLVNGGQPVYHFILSVE